MPARIQLLAFVFTLLPLAAQELPPPPPEVPLAVPGEPPPFDPAETQEAKPMPPLKIVLPDSSSTIRVSLVDAIATAWQNQPDVLEASGQLRRREGDVVTQRSALLPSIGVDTTYSHVVTKTTGGGGSVIVGGQVISSGDGGGSVNVSDRISARIGFSQLLTDFGRTRNLVLQADRLRAAAAADLLSTKNDVALSVKERYYDLTRRTGLVEVAEDDLANRQQQLALARALYDAGELAPGDVVRAESAVTASVVSLNQARLNLETSRQDLLVGLGISPVEEVEIEPFVEPELPRKELGYLLEKASEKRPDLLSAKYQVEASKAGLGAAYALNRPELSTFTGITYQGQVDGRLLPTLSAQLSLAFDIYDGGARAGAVTSAEGGLMVSEANLRRTELEVSRLVAQDLAQLITAEENVKAAQVGVESAREGVRIAEGRYRVALGSLTDVLDAQRAFVQARTDLVNSFNALNLARARIRHALAAPLEEDFQSLSTPSPPQLPDRSLEESSEQVD